MRTTIDDFRPAPDDSGLPLFASARRSDPPTSHAAARAVTPRMKHVHEGLILVALECGPAGKTRLAELCGLTDQQVIRRMRSLEREGLVVRTGREVLSAAGRAETEWKVKE
jgi:DNA-binding HxlR family transcriptional regulator